MAWLAGTFAAAGAPSPPPAGAATNHAVCLRSDRALTEADASAFFDGFLPPQMARMHARAAAIAIVHDGQVVLTRGYGSVTRDGSVRTDPQSSIFRLASTSKAFTLIAVMQMVEQGRLHLDDDAGRYIDFALDLPFGPVTIRNLLTHTAGFQSMDRDQFARTPDGIFSLRRYLVQTQPLQVRPPGSRVFYTNYDAVLLGYIVERVSGEPFQHYMAEHVFTPLGMPHTLFRRTDEQPAELVETDDTSDAYLQSMPGGGAMSTAADMGQFMLMLLGGGANAHGRVLRPETVRLMTSPARVIDPRTSPMALLLYRTDRHGVEILRHDGRLVNFISLMAIMPSCGTAIWAGYANTEVPTETDETLEVFLQRYFVLATPPKPVALPSGRIDVAGVYSLEYNPASILHFQDLFSQTRVRQAADSTVTADDMRQPDGAPRRFVALSPTLFVETNGRSRLAFSHFPGGDLRMAMDLPIKEYRRMPWYDQLWPNQIAIAVCATVFAMTLLLSGRRAIIGRHVSASGMDVAAGFGAVSGLLLGAYVAWLLSVEEIVDNTISRFDWLIYLMFGLATLVVISPAVFVATVFMRREPRFSAWRIVQALAMLTAAGLALHWNLASWNIRY